jgi:hypothetical protein
LIDRKARVLAKTGVCSILEVVAGFLTSMPSAASIIYLDDHVLLGYIDSTGPCSGLQINYYCKKENLKTFDYSTWMQQVDRQKSKSFSKNR